MVLCVLLLNLFCQKNFANVICRVYNNHHNHIIIMIQLIIPRLWIYSHRFFYGIFDGIKSPSSSTPVSLSLEQGEGVL